MCVVATYVIMHVIVYFGVCANAMVIVATYVSGCLIWLCNHVLISVCVCVCCSVCNPIAQHTHLIRSNHLCYYRSSHTFLFTDLFF